MRPLIVSVLMLFCAGANAEAYKCPQGFPGKDWRTAPLTGGTMAWGEDAAGLFAGDYSQPAQEGYDAAYPILDDEQAWLICSYGSKKRNKGKFHDGHEWNQYMEWSPIEWRVKLPPKVHNCTLQVREVKLPAPAKSTWTVTAVCKRPAQATDVASVSGGEPTKRASWGRLG